LEDIALVESVDALKYFLRLVEHCALLSLLYAGACALALRYLITETWLVVSFGLGAVAAAGYLAFWLWLWSGHIGHLYSFLIHILAAIFLVWEWRRGTSADRTALRLAFEPWLFTLAIGSFVVAAGFLYGGFSDPLQSPGSRFSHLIVADNALPYIFAEGLRWGRVGRPMLGDWLSSDRPPLQTGLTLLSYPFVIQPRERAYTVLAVLLQSLWAPSLWSLLRSFAISRKLCAWILAAVFSTGFVLVNSFFVWPKMLAASYVIAGFAVALSPFRRFYWLAGGLLAFGCLAHGASAFALIGLLPVVIFYHRRQLKQLIPLGISMIALYLPWILYQKLYDPPGDRLLKWHLAGVVQVDSRPFTQILIGAYKNLSWSQIFAVRRANMIAIFGHISQWWVACGRLFTNLSEPSTVQQIRLLQFFFFVPSLGIFMLGSLFLLFTARRKRNTVEWRLALLLTIYVLITLLVWGVLLFSPDAALIHQGTYVCGILAIAASVLSTWNVSRHCAQALIFLQAILSIVVYVIPGNSHFVMTEAILLVLSSVAVVLILRKLAQPVG
jgi:hypothetical protein